MNFQEHYFSETGGNYTHPIDGWLKKKGKSFAKKLKKSINNKPYFFMKKDIKKGANFKKRNYEILLSQLAQYAVDPKKSKEMDKVYPTSVRNGYYIDKGNQKDNKNPESKGDASKLHDNWEGIEGTEVYVLSNGGRIFFIDPLTDNDKDKYYVGIDEKAREFFVDNMGNTFEKVSKSDLTKAYNDGRRKNQEESPNANDDGDFDRVVADIDSIEAEEIISKWNAKTDDKFIKQEGRIENSNFKGVKYTHLIEPLGSGYVLMSKHSPELGHLVFTNEDVKDWFKTKVGHPAGSQLNTWNSRFETIKKIPDDVPILNVTSNDGTIDPDATEKIRNVLGEGFILESSESLDDLKSNIKRKSKLETNSANEKEAWKVTLKNGGVFIFKIMKSGESIIKADDKAKELLKGFDVVDWKKRKTKLTKNISKEEWSYLINLIEPLVESIKINSHHSFIDDVLLSEKLSKDSFVKKLNTGHIGSVEKLSKDEYHILLKQGGNDAGIITIKTTKDGQEKGFVFIADSKAKKFLLDKEILVKKAK